MKSLIILFFLFAFSGAALADDVHVNGYYRSNGTYVQPHVRSAPDSSRSNNYGPSEYYGQSPQARDSDNDGRPNYIDSDDDNDGRGDESDSSQYSISR
jgi:hypothetical protein